ncbi:MAG: asparagine synthase C-terminal domain-containing protein, partial [Bacteroidota bacterium]
SSAIVYTAQALRQKQGATAPINTFTAAFPGKEGDESEFVRHIEQDLGLNATYCNPFEEFSFEDFERFLKIQDMPVGHTSVYAQWSVMRLVGDSPVTVLLDGQGGDELFGGYHHHMYKMGRDLMLKGRFRKLNRLVAEFCELKGMDPKLVKKYIRDDVKLYFKLKMGKKLPGPPEATTWNAARSLSDVLRLDILSWIMPKLLRHEDRNSMAYGLEARLPFLDYRIVEFAMTLPDDFKIHKGWQKYILRQAMPDLPEKIRFRKDKKGFTTPHNEWMARYRKRFLELAEIAAEAGVKLPGTAKNVAELGELHLFRVANLGLLIRSSDDLVMA